MAYAFNETMGILGLTNPEEPGQANTTLSNDEGAIGGSGQSSAGGQQIPNAPVNSPTAGGKKRIMERNVGKSQAPADLQKINTGIQGAREGIQGEANAYMASADDNYEINNDQIRTNVQKHIKGQPVTDKDRWLEFFQQGTPSMVDPLKLKTNTNIEDVDLLKNDAGLRQLYRRQQDPEGTIGEAALDTALLRKNTGFNEARDSTVKDYTALQEERKGIERDSRTKAQDIANAASVDYKGRVRDVAGSLAPSYDTAAAEREKRFDDELTSTEAARRASAHDDAQAYLNRMADSGAYDEYVSQALRQALGEGILYNPNVLDAGSFYRPGKTADSTNVNDFYSSQEASEWNSLMSLLGRGGEVRAGGQYADGSGASLAGGLDFNALADAALKFAAPQGEATRKSWDEMEAARIAKEKAIAADQERKRHQEYLDAEETPEERAERLNKDESQWTEREKRRNEKEDKQIEESRKGRKMNSWNPLDWV